ncbi:hypothetical protein GGR56DRAFT_662030 [Xylariaceae sp. FL0804]|nr:hypothetical protein GGR56DRAFT_662030 [Xylariaceae sp. FL0804]
MSRMGRNQVYCCICGGPMMEHGQSDDERGEWLARAVLLTTAHEADGTVELDAFRPATPGRIYALELGSNIPHESQRRVLELDAQYEEHNRFTIQESGKTVAVFVVGAGSPAVTHGSDGCVYLAVHQIGPEDQISSVKTLWAVLFSRMPGSRPGDDRSELPDPHDYYGGRGCRNVYWESDDDPEYGGLLEENPWEIPNLTGTILENLQPEAPPTQEGVPKDAQPTTSDSGHS